MRENKKTSTSLVIFSTVIVSFIAFFLSMVYFKLNPPLNVSETEKVVDSATVIHVKDSLINVLVQDNKRLKQMFDEKHDTVWVPKPVYIKSKVDTLAN
jgi:PDZ domain-containing secreted protein